MDMFCLKNFHEELKAGINIVQANCSDEVVQNSLMSSEPNNDLWIEILNKAEKLILNSSMRDSLIKGLGGGMGGPGVGNLVRSLTGPLLLTRISNRVNILPSKLFNPAHNSPEWSDRSVVFTKHIMSGKWADGHLNKKHVNNLSDNEKGKLSSMCDKFDNIINLKDKASSTRDKLDNIIRLRDILKKLKKEKSPQDISVRNIQITKRKY